MCCASRRGCGMRNGIAAWFVSGTEPQCSSQVTGFNSLTAGLTRAKGSPAAAAGMLASCPLRVAALLTQHAVLFEQVLQPFVAVLERHCFQKVAQQLVLLSVVGSQSPSSRAFQLCKDDPIKAEVTRGAQSVLNACWGWEVGTSCCWCGATPCRSQVRGMKPT